MLMKAIAAAGLLGLAATSNAAVLYSQAWNGTSEAYSSQNDTTGGNGSFATAYDDFILGAPSYINAINWTGLYFNPSVQAPIDGFTFTLYDDAGGIPGNAFAFGFFTNYNETFVGAPDGFVAYSYSISFADYGPLAAGTYWLSLVPDLGFPPQWGWATSNTGNNNGYQDFFGTGTTIGVNFAFDVLGTAVPEPQTWAMMVIGFGGLGAAMRMARRRTHAIAA